MTSPPSVVHVVSRHPQSMKMDSTLVMMGHSARDEDRPTLERNSPPISLVWTSFRTPNCRLDWWRARRADCFTPRCPFARERSKKRGVRHGKHFPVLCWLGYTQRIRRSLCSTNGTRRTAPSADAPLGDHVTGHSVNGRLDGRTRCHPRSHGIYGSFLEADFQHSRGPFSSAAGECPSPEASAWAQERHSRLPVDCTTAAMWAAEGQLYSTPPPARVARSHSSPRPTGRRKNSHQQSH